MRINPISLPTRLPDLASTTSKSNATGMSDAPTSKTDLTGGPESFGATLKNAVRDVNGLQVEADQLASKMATGDLQDVHQAMVAMQKASLAMQFTVQVRNKVIEAYQEIMRTQV